MIRHGSVLLAASLLGMIGLDQPARADDVWSPFNSVYHAAVAIFDPPPSTYGVGYEKTPYVAWRARRELGLAAAPYAIANQPCYVYEGDRLVVAPCAGFAERERYAAETPVVIPAPIPAESVGYRRRWDHPGGSYVIRRAY